MFRGALKYCFLLLLYIPFITLNPKAKASGGEVEAYPISLYQQIDADNLTLHTASFDIKYCSAKISILTCMNLIQKRKHQNKLKVIDKLEAKLLTINFSNSFQKKSSQSKLIDQTNHCCFLI
ncbi:MAG: hypothetical protein ACYCVH_10345 [Ignavibacteriaceae bacterium]